MKMTKFKSLPNVFGIFLGLILVCFLGSITGLNAQSTYGLPILKSKAEIFQIAETEIKNLQTERTTTCTTQDPTAPCAKRMLALLGAYMDIQTYINDQPQMSEYDILKAVYPITNVHSLAVVPEAVNMSGFNDQKFNIYFVEILDRIKL